MVDTIAHEWANGEDFGCVQQLFVVDSRDLKDKQ